MSKYLKVVHYDSQYIDMVFRAETPEEIENVEKFFKEMTDEAIKRGLHFSTGSIHGELTVTEKLETVKNNINWIMDQIAEEGKDGEDNGRPPDPNN